MGASISKLFSGLSWAKKETRILILGLVSTSTIPGTNIAYIALLGQRWKDNASISTEGIDPLSWDEKDD